MLNIYYTYILINMCGIFGLISSVSSYFEHYNKASSTIQERGPERSIDNEFNNGRVTFHRLAINGLAPTHDQPYHLEDYIILCNGEIYNFKDIQGDLECDTESIYPLMKQCLYDMKETNRRLDGEYALVVCKLKENKVNEIWFSTDHLSLRPLFYSIDLQTNTFVFSSLLKGINDLDLPYKAERLPAAHIGYINFSQQIFRLEQYMKLDEPVSSDSIVDVFTESVRKRLQSDRPIGCLLSGGIDSSLVAAVAAKLVKEQKLRTFSIGMKGSPDLYYARMVADFIGSEHTEVLITEQDLLNTLPTVVETIESYDITTIRASTPQYLLAKYIKENTDIKVILNGDVSDEVSGSYLYFYYAPNDQEFQEETLRLLYEIHLYDGLRVDRTISSHGLEARFPFGDKKYLSTILNLQPSIKRPIQGKQIEKLFLREAFEPHNLLPKEVLYRTKAAFSDAISQTSKSWFEIIQEHVEKQELDKSVIYTHCQPISNESLWYRNMWSKRFNNERHQFIIPKFWMPRWTQANDPSARTLKVYQEVSDELK